MPHQPGRSLPARRRSAAPPTPDGTGRPLPAGRWSPAASIALRFSVIYLGLFALATQISGSMIPNLAFSYRGLGRLWPMRDITVWVGHLFGVTLAPEDAALGGEPAFFWVQTGWLLIASAVATAIWTFAGRRRPDDAGLHAGFRLFVRLALAASLFEYGMTKVIPTQFPAPSLETLVTPVGDLTLSAMLWTSIGAAPAYEIVTGAVEVLAGILLLVPRTTLIGALLALGAMTHVLVLNMTYDVGLKLVSFHLVLLAVFLLIPDASRLTDLFLRGQPAGAPARPEQARTARAARVALVAPLVAGIYLLGTYAYINVAFWQVGGGGAPKSALYGIWEVETLAVDGQIRPAVLNDYDRRWRRVIFDEPGRVVFQRTDDSFARYGTAIDADAGAMALTKGDSRTWRATFAFERHGPDRLTLSGDMDGHALTMELRRVELDTLRLLNSPFRWTRTH